MLPAAGSSGHPPLGYAGDTGLPVRPIATGALVIAALAIAVASILAAVPHALLPATVGASLVACALAFWATARARRRETEARAERRRLADRLEREAVCATCIP